MASKISLSVHESGASRSCSAGFAGWTPDSAEKSWQLAKCPLQTRREITCGSSISPQSTSMKRHGTEKARL